MCLQPVLGGGVLHAVCPRPDKPETKTRAKAIKEEKNQAKEKGKQSKSKRKRETSDKSSDAKPSKKPKKYKTETEQMKRDDDEDTKPVVEMIDSYAEVERIRQETAKDRLLFYSKSAKCAPGMGPKNKTELVHDPKFYNMPFFTLRCPDWRQRLSNFYAAPFTIHGVTFNTLEHAWHYFKIKEADQDKAHAFVKESGSTLSKGTGLDARNQRKMVVLTKAQLNKWSTKWFLGSSQQKLTDSLCDDWTCHECWFAKNEPVLDTCKICLSKRDKQRETEPLFQSVLRAKFEQNSECRAVLLETLSAQLWHTPGREPAVRWTWLEYVREEFRKAKDSTTTLKPDDKEAQKNQEQKQNEEKKERKYFKCSGKGTDGKPCIFTVATEGGTCVHREHTCDVDDCGKPRFPFGYFCSDHLHRCRTDECMERVGSVYGPGSACSKCVGLDDQKDEGVSSDKPKTEEKKNKKSKHSVYPYDKRRVNEIAQEVDFANWKCKCNGSGSTSGACPLCAWGDELCWECGSTETCVSNCKMAAALDAEPDMELYHYTDLIKHGILKKPKWYVSE